MATQPNPLRVLVDIGPVGHGASNARFLQAENGSEYVAKAPQLAPNNPYVGANEVICAELAIALGLPTLEWRLLEMAGELYFGCQRIDFAPLFDATILNQSKNADRVYDLVAFDVWVLNTDRHDGNIKARKLQNDPNEYALLMIDHSHAVLSPGTGIADCAARAAHFGDELIRSQTVRRAVTDGQSLEDAFHRIEGVADDTISLAVSRVPAQWLPDPEKAVVESMLRERRNRMTSHFIGLAKTTLGIA